ncbi:hypothetical protein BGZ75_009719 [Mortierella antarctica]|nr:hypothetical protein BGZ75_009719 [Mortierella antarctica]
MTDILTLFCLVDGETTSKAFPVDISSTSTIGHLKKLIKAEKTPRFDDVAADELTLWQVSIHTSDDDDVEEAPVELDKLNEKKKLSPAKSLSKLFVGSLPEETVHILIQRPPSADAMRVMVRVLTYPTLHIPWTVNANTATRESLLATIFNTLPALKTDGVKLTVHYSVQEDLSQQQCSEDLEDDNKLQDVLRYNHRRNVHDLKLMISTGNKAFNQVEWTDLPKFWGIDNYPSFGPIGHTDFGSCEKEWNVLMEQLSGFVKGNICLRNERESSAYVLSFIARARMLYPELRLDCETPLNGSYGHGKADIGVHAIGTDNASHTIGITEVKISKTIKNGLAQNGAQLEATNAAPTLSTVVSYGIVTDAKEWYFLRCTMKADTPIPVIQCSKIETVIDYTKEDWDAKAKIVFSSIVWLFQQMAEEVEKRGSSKKSRV